MSSFFQRVFKDKVISRRQAEYEQLRKEREEGITQILKAKKQERETRRKIIFYLRSEEEKADRIREEEEGRKREGFVSSIPNASSIRF